MTVSSNPRTTRTKLTVHNNQASAAALRSLSHDSSRLILFCYPFCHDTTLQHHRLLVVKTNDTRFIS